MFWHCTDYKDIDNKSMQLKIWKSIESVMIGGKVYEYNINLTQFLLFIDFLCFHTVVALQYLYINCAIVLY